MDCYKCGIRPAKIGGLCEKCAKGLSANIQFNDLPEGKYTFEEFYNKYLKDKPEVQAIAIADDELMLYKYYKIDDRFVPNLMGDLGFRPEYLKLEEWFIEKFFKVLRDRIKMIDPKAFHSEHYKRVKKNFLKFRYNINKVLFDMAHNERYIGTADINPLLIFLK